MVVEEEVGTYESGDSITHLSYVCLIVNRGYNCNLKKILFHEIPEIEQIN